MTAIEFKIEGLDELESRLERIGKKVGSKFLRQALSKAATPVVRAAKQKAPVDSGALRQSIGKSTQKGRGKNVASVAIGPKKGNARALALANSKRSKPIRGIFYAHIVELGYGRQPPQPFLRPALDETANTSVEIFGNDLKVKIESVT